MEKVQRLAPNRTWAEVSVVLTDDAGIVPINSRHLGSEEVTDVISFCYDPVPGENADLPASGHDSGQGLTGEIIVNVQRAAERGAGHTRWGAGSELALYLAHGCDHLADETDYDPRGRTRMRRRELRWLRQARREGLLERLA